MNKINNEILKKGFEILELLYDNDIEDKFQRYKELLKDWNKKINITRIDNDEDIYVKHFLDSVLLLDKNTENVKKKIIDVGTGGGFPGIPLKIANSNYEVTLLDSLKKRVDFLDVVVSELKLDNMEVLHGRAEDYGTKSNYREKFDICVSRAVAPLNVLCEYCIPFVKVGGYFAAYKSENISEEIIEAKNAIEILGCFIKELKVIKLPETDIVRKIVVIEKLRKSDKIYPRKAGKPTKEPLI